MDPHIADAAILTGYGLNGSNPQLLFEAFAPRVARRQRPRAFAAFDSGYLTTVDVFATIQEFFKAPDYDPAIARFAEANKSPFAVSEVTSLFVPSVPLDAAKFAGPVLVISGEFDFPICGGYCPGVIDQPVRGLFRGSKGFESYVQPGAGHGTNFAKNATGFYGVIFDFLKRKGL